MKPTCEVGEIGGYTFTQDGTITYVHDEYSDGQIVCWVEGIDMFMVVDVQENAVQWVDQLVAVRWPSHDYDADQEGLAERWLAQDLEADGGPVWIFDGKELPAIQRTDLKIVFVLGYPGEF